MDRVHGTDKFKINTIRQKCPKHFSLIPSRPISRDHLSFQPLSRAPGVRYEPNSESFINKTKSNQDHGNDRSQIGDLPAWHELP